MLGFSPEEWVGRLIISESTRKVDDLRREGWHPIHPKYPIRHMGCVSYASQQSRFIKGSIFGGGKLGSKNLVRVSITREGYEVLTLIKGRY